MTRVLVALCWFVAVSALVALDVQAQKLEEDSEPIPVAEVPLGPSGSPALQVEGKNVITQNAFAFSAVVAHDPNNLISSLSDYGSLTDDDNFVVVVMPFSVEFGGVSYGTISISTNGWVRFGTATSSDFSNDCLPSGFAGGLNSDPFLAAYWDDLVSTVEYGWVGTDPNRTFIVNWVGEICCGSAGDSLTFQAQIHEMSSLVNVKYLVIDSGTLTVPDVTGANATIGFQAAGGAAAQAYPLTCNGQILDEFFKQSQGWSIAPLR